MSKTYWWTVETFCVYMMKTRCNKWTLVAAEIVPTKPNERLVILKLSCKAGSCFIFISRTSLGFYPTHNILSNTAYNWTEDDSFLCVHRSWYFFDVTSDIYIYVTDMILCNTFQGHSLLLCDCVIIFTNLYWSVLIWTNLK